MRLWGGGRTKVDDADGQVATADPVEPPAFNVDVAKDGSAEKDSAEKDSAEKDSAEDDSAENGVESVCVTDESVEVVRVDDICAAEPIDDELEVTASAEDEAEVATDDDDGEAPEPTNDEARQEDAGTDGRDDSEPDEDGDEPAPASEVSDEPAVAIDDDDTADAAGENLGEPQDDNDRADQEVDGDQPSTSDRDVRDGSPAVSDGLRRGVDPGQAEGLAGWELAAIAKPVVAVLAAFAIAGLLIGVMRDVDEVVRRDLVYSLDGSVPDGFLREDRRLLTQIVTLTSDAVLTPVAEEQDMTVDELRGRIDVETVDMSEVLRLDVTAPDEASARAISDAVVDQYVVISITGASATNSAALVDQRTRIATDLATAEDELKALRRNEVDDARLLTTEESLDRQIELVRLQIDRIQGLLDDTLVQATPAARQATLQAELVAAETELTDLEGRLAEVRVERAVLAEKARAEPSLTRDIDRLEAELTTIDDELSARELAPLMVSPLRELGEPTVVERSPAAAAQEGLALGVLVGLPFAAMVALAVRRRQLSRR